MLPLTAQERRVAVFLFIIILAGTAINYSVKNRGNCGLFFISMSRMAKSI